MNSISHGYWLHRFAWLIATLTLLLPVTTGAVVTTLKAGMVFADWPSSDGYHMFAYPWLSSARDEFVEHGHRLAGVVIGLLSITLVLTAWFFDHRRPVRVIAGLIFGAVVCQGMLGGARVLLDQQTLALLHGDFAALVFSLMAILVLITSPGWESRSHLTSITDSHRVSLAAKLVFGCLLAQYVMGGFLRHLRERSEFAWAWMVHPWFAIAVILVTILFALVVRGSSSKHLVRCAYALVGLAIVQSSIGLATWYVKYGLPSWGVVAQQDSLGQIIVCSLHKVVGMLTLMTSVVAVVCCWASKPLQSNSVTPDSVGHKMAGVLP